MHEVYDINSISLKNVSQIPGKATWSGTQNLESVTPRLKAGFVTFKVNEREEISQVPLPPITPFGKVLISHGHWF